MLRLITKNIVDTAFLTAEPDLAENTYIDNLKYVSRSKVIRTNVLPSDEIVETTTLDNIVETTSGDFFVETGGGSGVNTQSLKLRLVPNASVSAIVLGRHTLPLNATVKIYLYTTSDWTGTPAYSDTSLTITSAEAGDNQVDWDSYLNAGAFDISDLEKEFNSKANFVHWLPSVENNIGSIQIDIGNFSNNVEISRLIIGEYIQPEVGASFNHQISFDETSKQYRTEASTLRSDITTPNKKFSFSIDTIVESDRNILFEELQYVGKQKDLFISMFINDEKESDYSGIMKLTKIPIITEFGDNFYKSKYEMREV